MPAVFLAVEGVIDAAVLQRVLIEEGFEVLATYGLRGKANLDSSLAGFNNAARFAPWVVVRDLDHDADCGAALAAALMPNPSEWMRFRVAVREPEAWLMADRDALADYLRVRRNLIPADPDVLDDPKQALVNLSRRSSRSVIVGDMVPAEGMSGVVGPGYTARVSEYAAMYWRPTVAAQHSDSLRRCLQRVRELMEYPY
jgi:hypothetical protein